MWTKKKFEFLNEKTDLYNHEKIDKYEYVKCLY
jgi:hypothetical protein